METLTIVVRGTTSTPSTDDGATRDVRAQHVQPAGGKPCRRRGVRVAEATGERRAHD